MTSSFPGWVQGSVFYQIFPERFANGDPSNDPPGTRPWGDPPAWDSFSGGDLQGILDRLPYLEELGVSALYLTPIFKARSNHKYDTSDYLQVDPAFGDTALLRRLVAAAHQRGMRVVLDAVFNHCGDGFWAFEDLMSRGQASPYKEWFFPRSFPICQDPPNYQTCGGAGFLPKLNVDHPDVRHYLLEVATFWIEQAGIDGWRLDVPWKAPLDFWRQFRSAVRRANPEAYIVAEAWRDPAPWLAGDTCDGIMNYPLRETILDFCARDTMDAEDFSYFCSRLFEDYGQNAFYQLNLLGSHDTARLLTLCRGDVERACLAMVAQFTLPGVPMVYYGDEVGLEGGNDPDCRRCMEWDPARWNSRLYNLVRQLIRCRGDHPALQSGRFEPLLTFNGLYAFRRILEEDEVLVVINPRAACQDLEIPLSTGHGEWYDLFSGKCYPANDKRLFLGIVAEKSALILSSAPPGEHPESRRGEND